ncbi:ADP-heptose:LPS heptosyltransferase [Deinobacterium chartae]|uniref:ADP-heptose:LPS heptosyltransferase n=1 Tax=Deinobacterium chartae TaxID=521158 RepID=A0A841HV77_9DEIO|nr:ADP-heptose:LPS heptosyltransferase [Deinobacterium chartae]
MLTAAPRFDGVNKIAVLRPNALGDYIVTVPALEALRAAYPQAEIVLLGKAWHRDFLSGRPGPVDRVEVVPPTPGVGAPEDSVPDTAAQRDFFERMRAERFDLAVQVYGGGRYSNPFTLALGARHTVGSRTPDALPLEVNVPYPFYRHEVLRGLEVAAAAGAAPVVLEPRVAVINSDLEEAARVVAPGKWVVLHPGASDPRRRWPPEKFARVGDALAERGLQVAVTGTGSERPAVEAVVAAMRAPALNLCDRLSLGGLTGLLSRSALVISNDTGPRHLAGAVGTPTVGIYWCGNVINAAPVTAARHAVLFSWQLYCPVCGTDTTRSRCEHDVSFVADVRVEDVLEEAFALLERSGQDAHPIGGPGSSR